MWICEGSSSYIILSRLSARTWNYSLGNGRFWQCYDFISPTCDPWQRRFPLCPVFMLKLIMHFFLPFSFFLHHQFTSHVSITRSLCSPDSSSSSPCCHNAVTTLPRKPRFQEPNPAEGLKTLTRWGVWGRLSGFWGEDGDVFLDLDYDLRDWPLNRP